MSRLSPTTLNFFLKCPHCFWLSIKKGINPPSCPIPTITNGIDRVIKEYMNRYRTHGKLPPFLEGKVPGRLIRFLPRSLEFSMDGNILKGKLDECLVVGDEHVPLDHKTKGYAPRDDHKVHEAYQFQMDCYTFLLEKNGHKINNTGYIVYYYPDFGELHNGIPFRVIAHKLDTCPERAFRIFKEALECIDGEEPAPSKTCEMCNYVSRRSLIPHIPTENVGHDPDTKNI